MKRQTPYQAWYTKALHVLRQLYPERADDLQAHYRALLALPGFAPASSWYRNALRVLHRRTARRSQDAKDPERVGWQTCLGMTITANGEIIPSVRLTFLAHFS